MTWLQKAQYPPQYGLCPNHYILAFMVRVALVLVSLFLCGVPARAGGVADADAGVARLNAGDSAAAAELFTRAIQSKELSAERLALTYHHRGMAFHREGRAGRAILDYTTALWNQHLRKAFRPRVLNNRGLSYEAINDFTSAMRDYNLALRMNDEYAEAYCSRGNLHRRFHRYEMAIADYDLALRNDHPQPKYVFVWQSLSLEGLGKRREAMDALRRALSIDPEFKLAKAHLDRLSATQSLGNVLGRRKPGKSAPPAVLSAAPGLHPTAVTSELNAAPWTPPAPAIVKKPSLPEPAPVQENGPELRPAAYDDQSRGLEPAPAVQPRRPNVVAAAPKQPVPAPRVTAPSATTAPATPPRAVIVPPLSGEGGSDAEYALQLGTFKSEDLAEKGWSSVLKVAGNLVGGLSHVVEEIEADKAQAYRLFAEALPDREAALGLCRTLRDKGVPCIVVRR
jgi:tetratricopeptide (TPR) repeat protein